MRKFKIAIIGCGRISYKHLQGILDNRNEMELVALCDISVDKANGRREEYLSKLNSSDVNSEISIYEDYKKMIEKEEIDIISISTESGYHPAIAIYCMERKKHIIVEKPMALSVKDADNMIQTAKSNNVKLCVCHQNRFNEPIQKLREAIDGDRFGNLINGTARILWNRNMGYYEQAPWRGTWELDGGTLMNQCIHNIDLLQWMMGGEIDTVFAMADTYIRDIQGEDFGAIMIRFKNGAIGLVEGSACVYPKNLEETLSIFGEKGTVCIGGLAVNKIETWRFGDEIDSEKEILENQGGDPDSVYGYGHSPLFKDFIDAINEDKEPLISGEQGKKALSIILAAYKSRKTGLPVKFPLEDFSTMEMIDNLAK